MRTVIRSGRFYFWPIILANGVAMTWVLGGDLTRGLALSLAIALLASFGFLLNDLWDREVDRVNEAGHFEHASRWTMRVGVGTCVSFLVGGLGTAYLFGIVELLLAAAIATGLTVYTVIARRVLVVPTILAAVLATSPLWAPMVLWTANVRALSWLFIVALVAIIAARETLMDVRDRVGDAAGDRETLATVFGPAIAKFVSVMLTMSGSIVLLVLVVMTVQELSLVRQALSVVISGIIVSMLVVPAMRTLRERDDRAVIQHYVLWSRVGMGLVPVLVIVLWHA